MAEGNTFYVIRYSGRDIPGLLFTTSDCLHKLGFNIDGVSMASGAELHTTFITCHYENKNTNRESNSQRDEFILRDEVRDALEEHYKSYFKGKEKYDATNDIEVTVKTMLSAPARKESSTGEKKFELFFDLRFADKPGVLAAVTDALRLHFTLDDAYVRPIPHENSKRTDDMGLYVRLSYYEVSERYKPVLKPGTDEYKYYYFLIDHIKNIYSPLEDYRKGVTGADIGLREALRKLLSALYIRFYDILNRPLREGTEINIPSEMLTPEPVGEAEVNMAWKSTYIAFDFSHSNKRRYFPINPADTKKPVEVEPKVFEIYKKNINETVQLESKRAKANNPSPKPPLSGSEGTFPAG